ncbi:hypothetical protein P8917_01040 [Bacillus atrophaeus]|uniref:hypothetical protein n=1 Tax=Bacillus atrophaeus TaxID=1452 RepID=UPI00227FA8AC|nr:hypothetical protein [Bacillus atrophaeus]MCY8813654.1 hypothetical protein [Bacillus atrophaeus]MCY8820273.1 hypothetical protein [Bacillus atrophaeus]MCY8828603.1 hypothetical protein [Bacillus atrophaeus]MCY8832690.1 hypothetical protein [Bacillus atrophaeus]MEC0749776.1 hypothetical protein [Bacillus atrophaeus]
MAKNTIDFWENTDGKVKLIITDLLRMSPYSSTGYKSPVSLFDEGGNYVCRIRHMWRDADFVSDIFKALETDSRFKNFKLAFDNDINMYEFAINEHEDMPYRSYNTNSVNAVINTTYEALINMSYPPETEGAE